MVKGCRRTKYGWLCQLRIHGERFAQRFPADTPDAVMARWHYDLQATHRTEVFRPHSGRFCDDATRYLDAVQAMPTYDDRARDIERWSALFGTRLRSTITAPEIATQLQAWRSAGVAASTCNHRRTALAHLWTTLDGKAARNPVRDVPKFPEPRPQPRALAYADIQRVLAAMPDTASRARLAVMAFTGLPGKQLGLLTDADVDLRRKVVRVPGRAKGAGAPGRTLPLSPDAVAAFKALARQQAYGPFSNSSLGKAWKQACRRVLHRDDLSPYVLRHSWGTELYRRTGDLHAVGQLLLHSSPTLTARYALAAVPERLRQAVAAAVPVPPTRRRAAARRA